MKEIVVLRDNYNAGDIQKYSCSRNFIHFYVIAEICNSVGWSRDQTRKCTPSSDRQ